MKPSINQVYLDANSQLQYRVVGHKPDCNEIYVIEIKNKQATGMPTLVDHEVFLQNRFHKFDYDPLQIDRLEEEITDAEKACRDNRSKTIVPLASNYKIFDPEWRNNEINSIICEKGALKKTSIYKLLKQYWVYGSVENSLLPKFENCGNPGKERNVTKSDYFSNSNSVPKRRKILTEKDKEMLRNGFRKYYIRNPKSTLRQAIVNFLAKEKYFENEMPSLTQFIYWGRKLNDPLEIIKKRSGETVYEKDLRVLTGSSRDNVFGPCSEVMIDSTIDNVRVVSSDNSEKYIGRLTVYFSIDVFSGLITGVYVSPEHASYVVGCLCILNMAEDKIEFCKKYEIDITHDMWPCHFLPGRILADRAEFLGNRASSLTKNLGIDLSNTPSRRPDLKGLVEKQFNYFQSKLKSLLHTNGLIDKNDEPRITQDSRKKACLNLNDMLFLIIKEILYYNKNHWMKDYPLTRDMRKDQIEPTPLNIWNWAISNGLGNLKQLDKRTIWRNCLPRHECRFSREGIRFSSHDFVPTSSDGWKIVEKMHAGGKKKCTVAFNPLGFSQTYLCDGINFYQLRTRNGASYSNYFELEDLAGEMSERKVLHERRALRDEILKRREQIDRVDHANKQKAKKVDIKNVRLYKKEAIKKQRKQVMNDVDSQPQIKQSKPEVSARLKSLPSFTETLKNL